MSKVSLMDWLRRKGRPDIGINVGTDVSNFKDICQDGRLSSRGCVLHWCRPVGKRADPSCAWWIALLVLFGPVGLLFWFCCGLCCVVVLLFLPADLKPCS